ncbi:MAG: hypothetical protein M3Y27_27570, partial [Acidobacteriota bacterium]|nr:hypothetical protein [Acidobacteriota bacterium]
IRSAGPKPPGGLRVYLPKASAREDFTRMISTQQKTLAATTLSRVSTDHSRASPVASALGIRLGATPRGTQSH